MGVEPVEAMDGIQIRPQNLPFPSVSQERVGLVLVSETSKGKGVRTQW
jgi:hypothetical protein